MDTPLFHDTLLRIGQGHPLVLFCGPCVIESREKTLWHAERISNIAREQQIPLVFKSSYDKANRTSSSGFRGLGFSKGLEILAEVRRELALPVVTDVHSPEEAREAAEVVDVLQIPAFLCRQTDLLEAAGRTERPVLAKKGQFLPPQDMAFVAEKVIGAGGKQVMLCERGTCFGYRDLVVDMRGLHIMRTLGHPVVFDGTHAVQSMGGAGGASSGNRGFVAPLVRAALAVGIDGLFLEAHEDPDHAPSDGPNMLPLEQLRVLLGDVRRLAELALETRDAS